MWAKRNGQSKYYEVNSELDNFHIRQQSQAFEIGILSLFFFFSPTSISSSSLSSQHWSPSFLLSSNYLFLPSLSAAGMYVFFRSTSNRRPVSRRLWSVWRDKQEKSKQRGGKKEVRWRHRCGVRTTGKFAQIEASDHVIRVWNRESASETQFSSQLFFLFCCIWNKKSKRQRLIVQVDWTKHNTATMYFGEVRNR